MFKHTLFASVLIAFLCVECFAKLRNYDNFDLEALLQDSKRSKAFFECFRDENKCTKEDKEMKEDLLEMVTTSCASCTAKEKKKYGDARKALQQAMASQVITKFIHSQLKMTDMFQGLNITEVSSDK